ncbi:hypothetical protein LWM68_31735 [Niabella sp. W65]|nr:hypothetical protein [Niabella sp. W65]MCH7366937.1 hypothetical protein [Niabella sp. W65]ULT42630.1 hypothetical protein KRR40_03275 [Niabella sp. I65]
MKAAPGIAFSILLHTAAFARQHKDGIVLTCKAADTTRVIKQYWPDSTLLSVSHQEMINGCWKELIFWRCDSGVPAAVAGKRVCSGGQCYL